MAAPKVSHLIPEISEHSTFIYINGENMNQNQARKCSRLLQTCLEARVFKAELSTEIELVYNATTAEGITSAAQKDAMNFMQKKVKRRLIELCMRRVQAGGVAVLLAHHQGAELAISALRGLPADIKPRVAFITFAGSKVDINPNLCGLNVNYCNDKDLGNWRVSLEASGLGVAWSTFTDWSKTGTLIPALHVIDGKTGYHYAITKIYDDYEKSRMETIQPGVNEMNYVEDYFNSEECTLDLSLRFQQGNYPTVEYADMKDTIKIWK